MSRILLDCQLGLKNENSLFIITYTLSISDYKIISLKKRTVLQFESIKNLSLYIKKIVNDKGTTPPPQSPKRCCFCFNKNISPSIT